MLQFEYILQKGKQIEIVQQVFCRVVAFLDVVGYDAVHPSISLVAAAVPGLGVVPAVVVVADDLFFVLAVLDVEVGD